MSALKMRSIAASHQKLTTTNWEPSSKLILLHGKLPKNSMSTILQSFSIWSKLERWKKVSKCVPHELTENQKIVVLNCHLYLFYITTTNNFSIRLWRATKSEFYTTTRSEQLSVKRSSKALSKVKLTPKKRLWSVWWSAAVGSTISERYAQQIDEMHWKLQHLQPALVNKKGLILLHDNAQPHVIQPYFKTWMKWTRIFCFICHIPWSLANWLSLFKQLKSCLTTFCRENASTTSRMQKMSSKSSSNPEAQIFTLQE